jgi:hypothetical protein
MITGRYVDTTVEESASPKAGSPSRARKRSSPEGSTAPFATSPALDEVNPGAWSS